MFFIFDRWQEKNVGCVSRQLGRDQNMQKKEFYICASAVKGKFISAPSESFYCTLSAFGLFCIYRFVALLAVCDVMHTFLRGATLLKQQLHLQHGCMGYVVCTCKGCVGTGRQRGVRIIASIRRGDARHEKRSGRSQYTGTAGSRSSV